MNQKRRVGHKDKRENDYGIQKKERKKERSEAGGILERRKKEGMDGKSQ